MINALVFDVDDTLYQQVEPFKNAIMKTFPSFDINTVPKLFIRFRYHSDLHFEKSVTGIWSLEKMREERITAALNDLDFKDINPELAKTFQNNYEKELRAIKLDPEIKSALSFLHEKKIPLGIITNGPKEHQQKKIDSLQVTEFISPEAIFISGAVGSSKPDELIFSLAAKQLQLPADNILYIGDSYENDVIGAKNAGFKVWWFNHQNRKLTKDQLPFFDLEINTFSDMSKKITSLNF
ncbi:HAD family hydrolase [Enterococcus alishanensis]|uniref:HAD family hydrolase n=1 Tax=Enterococcus alishanensis TaxID=1303817 RepID=A0ABS6TF71_9ENTE|nr:HAD family hydrolase [Enterococcus alishanensis]MBV7391555.1 HAD family hydrolase [Enterococcus alishanensis]